MSSITMHTLSFTLAIWPSQVPLFQVMQKEYGKNTKELTKQGESSKGRVPSNKVSVVIQPCPAILPGCTHFIKGLASAEIAGCITVCIEK